MSDAIEVTKQVAIQFEHRSDGGALLVGPFASEEAANEALSGLLAADVDFEGRFVALSPTTDTVDTGNIGPDDAIAPETDPEDAAEGDEMPVDEPEDDEELITEIPVHGVATVEGRPTGDGRGFRPNALSFASLPQPLGYEFESGHGSDNSRVAVIGRIDAYSRKEIGDGVSEIRWTGVIMPGKPYAGQAIEGILDGSYTGLSVIIDSVTEDLTEAKEQLLATISGADPEGEKSFDQMSPEELNAFVDDMLGDGTRPTTWFSAANIRRFDMVPTGAFVEGWTGLGHEFADDLTPEQITAAAEALADCGCTASLAQELGLEDWEIEDIDPLADPIENARRMARAVILASAFKDYPAADRKKMADEGTAMPDGSFPIANVDDLKNAIQAIGRASDPAAAKAHIKKRAAALGQSALIPDGWDAEVIAFAPGTHDGPGWITHPVPTERIRHYWTKGKGAAKIGWGTPGDFNRCRMQLAKYVANPDWLAGMCANMHKEVLGIWPATHAAADRKHALIASGATPGPLFTLLAAAEPVSMDYFRDPRLTEATGLTIEGDHVYGHIAAWNVCHIGEPEGRGTCTIAPHSSSNYAHYRTGTIITDEGPAYVGSITMGTGHAADGGSPLSAISHYDNTGAVVADVACGEDAYGIWFSGRIRPSATDDQVEALRASGRLSGDWRWIGGSYELVAALAVNVPGFPIPRAALVASGVGVTAILAAGIVPPETSVDPAAITIVETGSPEQMAELIVSAIEVYEIRKERAEITKAARPARAALSAIELKAARGRLAEITKD